MPASAPSSGWRPATKNQQFVSYLLSLVSQHIAANIGFFFESVKLLQEKMLFQLVAKKKAGLAARFFRSYRLTSLRIGTISAV
jgi:hypothetical protein